MGKGEKPKTVNQNQKRQTKGNTMMETSQNQPEVKKNDFILSEGEDDNKFKSPPLIDDSVVEESQEPFQDLFIKGISMNNKQMEALDQTIWEFSNKNTLVDPSFDSVQNSPNPNSVLNEKATPPVF